MPFPPRSGDCLPSPLGVTPILALFAALSASAQIVPKLDPLPTIWFQRGTTQELTLTGGGWLEGSSVQITGSGVTGRIALAATTNVTLITSGTGLSSHASATAATSASGQLILESDAPLGPREIRVVGPGGVSNSQTLQVSDLPEVLESAVRKNPPELPTLSLPFAVSGRVGQPTEVDGFRFHARKGERLVLDLQANRTGSPLDAVMLLFDESGRELARNEDGHGLDPYLEFVPAVEGDYVVKVHDLRFQGGDSYRYRLVVGVLPYLERLFPFAGRRGTSVELSFAGANLEGAQRRSLTIAADAPLGRQDFRVQTAAGHSNPLPFEVDDLPEINETEPNPGADKATPLPIPGAVNGRIGEVKDVDVFRCKSDRDQKLVFEVQARRFGSPLDVLLTLAGADGAVLQQNDDGAGGVDARLEADLKAGQEYLVTLRDLTDRGGEAFGYRLTVRPPDTAPGYTVTANNARLRVPAGGTTAVKVEVARRNGLDSLVTVLAENLPPGVSATPVVLDPRGSGYGWMIFTADKSTARGSSPLRLFATAEHSGQVLRRDVSLPEAGFISVLAPVPFSVATAQASVMIEQNATAELDVAVFRPDGFNGEVKVTAEEFPGLGRPGVTLTGGQGRAKLPLNAEYNSAPGVRPLLIRAEATINGIPFVTHALAPVAITTLPIPWYLIAMLPGSTSFRSDVVKLSAVALPQGTASEANQTEFVVKLERRGFPGEIGLAVDGLPAGIAATVGALGTNLNEAAIKLLVSETAETGKEYTLAVLATATNGDRVIRQRTQAIKLNVMAPEKPVATTTNSASTPRTN